MKKLLAMALFAAACGGLLAEITDEEILQQVIKDYRKQYEKDMKTSQGRSRWWGKLEKQIIDTNKFWKIEVYANGQAITNNWQLITPKDSVKIRKEYLASLTNGVPKALAEARKRLAIQAATLKNAGISNVLHTVTIGGKTIHTPH